MEFPSVPRRVRPGGLVVAIVGFVLSRFVVAESLRAEAALPFLVGGLLPLVLGLGLAVYGVVLTIGAFDRAYVNAIARWCLIGTGAMVFVFAVTALTAVLRGEMMRPFVGSGTLVANVLLGGAIGGALLGERSAVNRQQREEIRRQANRGIVLNRLLRHEVLNAATIVDGYAPLLSESESGEAVDAIREAAGRITTTVEDVGAIADDVDAGSFRPVDLAPALREAIADVREASSGADIRVGDLPTSIHVRADERLGLAIRELLRHAVANGEEPRVEVDLRVDADEAHLVVSDDGSPLDPDQRELLRDGSIPEFDDPSTGFSLQIAWLLLDRYGADFDVPGPESSRSVVDVSLPRTVSDREGVMRVGVTEGELYRAATAGIVAGVAMGLILQGLTGLLPVIGSLYGVASPVVGWTTHLFHSVVFALLFAAGCAWLAAGDDSGALRITLLGIAWGALLAVFAAGLLMPAWLRLLGFDRMLPNVSPIGLFSHLVWGTVLGLAYDLLRDRWPTDDLS